MLYAVTMVVDIPRDLDEAERTETLAREKAYCQDLQRGGEWVSIWRLPGQYANLSIFDVADHDRLHEILWNLPLFAFMEIDVQPLAQHPSALPPGER
ncbi:muconolactone Delta-isomerase [Knoellia sp. CPCC 206435]|uniref:muconolactone Delta-isomerase n=1 Tax=Knoellia terrae TaxID=3404797 RepID=UPI003B43895F